MEINYKNMKSIDDKLVENFNSKVIMKSKELTLSK
jgi:hypothetical protein